ncbi:uncharacterized protein [Lolium perenne]|uniref:uncharacterized protein n=1 Tax=Lolium perenne TaxID=4522 RepID=UPI0021E9EC66|nr:uncharacterized protein LOC127330707 [Lolium perenne]
MQRQLSTPEMPLFAREEEEEADLEAKPEKAPPSSSERYIHLIPVLTLLCFVVLFLCSHAPSPADMASFGGKAAGSGKPKSL